MSWAVVVACAIAGAGCNLYYDDDEPGTIEDECHPSSPVIAPNALRMQFVIDTIDVPDSPSQATELGIDLDGDRQGRTDNAFGQILSVFTSQGGGYDLDAEQNALIESGDILHLLEVQTTSADTALDVGITVLHGTDLDDDPTDNLSGAEIFEVDETRGQGTMFGCIRAGEVDVRRGTIPVAITFPGLDQPFIVDMSAAQISGRFTDTGLQGIIAGAVRERDIDEKVIPALTEGLNRVVARDCAEGVCEGFGEVLIDLFDSGESGDFSVDELRSSNLIGSLFSPDVDLFDAIGNYNPRADGVKDSLSIGLGFTAVGAQIR